MSYEEPESKGMSTGAIVAIVAVVVVVVLGLACCGGVVFWGRSMANKFQDAVTEDPQKIAEITDSIIDIDIPAEYPPQNAINFNWFGVQMKMCFYMSDDQGRGVILMQMAGPGQANPDQMKQAFQQQMQQQGVSQDLDIASTETRKFTINGEECEFEFVTGKERATGKEVHHVSGVFTGRGGAAYIVILEKAETWDEDAVVKMIESMSGGGSETGAGERAAPPDANAAPADATTAPD